MRMNDEDFRELGKELGHLGRGIYYIWNAFATNDGLSDPYAYGEKLTGWSLLYNRNKDLVFLHTSGYWSGHVLKKWPAPGIGWVELAGKVTEKHDSYSCPNGPKCCFLTERIAVKSRDSDHRFMVFSGGSGVNDTPRDRIIEYAKIWGGYEVTGEEKDYYIGLIEAGLAELGLNITDHV